MYKIAQINHFPLVNIRPMGQMRPAMPFILAREEHFQFSE